MRLRHREAKQLAQGHTARKWQSRDLNPEVWLQSLCTKPSNLCGVEESDSCPRVQGCSMGPLGSCAGRGTQGALCRWPMSGGFSPGSCGRGQPGSLRMGRLRTEQHLCPPVPTSALLRFSRQRPGAGPRAQAARMRMCVYVCVTYALCPCGGGVASHPGHRGHCEDWLDRQLVSQLVPVSAWLPSALPWPPPRAGHMAAHPLRA